MDASDDHIEVARNQVPWNFLQSISIIGNPFGQRGSVWIIGNALMNVIDHPVALSQIVANPVAEIVVWCDFGQNRCESLCTAVDE